jgi:subtilisin family serine protease
MQLRALCSLGLLLIACESEPAPAPRQVAAVQAALTQAFDAATDARVDVIVSYRDPMAASMERFEARNANARSQERLIAKNPTGFELRRRFAFVNAIAARIDRDALERLQQDPDVAYIQLDGEGRGALKEAVPAIGADKVHDMLHITGKGVTVAVLDTGADTTHPDLKDAIVGQHCFTQFDCQGANESNSAEDDQGHGSNVAGIVASRGIVSSPGFAPGASLVPVKINDANDSGRTSDWVSGFDWVFDNLAMLHVNLVNASICTTALYADAASCDAGEPALAKATKNLIDAGVTVFSASGNLGMKDQLSAPACNTGVVAVAATYDSNVGEQPEGGGTYAQKWGSAVANCADKTTDFDQITCFSNTPKRVDVVAPGAPIISDGLNGKTEVYRGTSQASPAAAGVAALMLECNPKLKPAEILATLKSTGVPRMDPKNGNTFPSIRAMPAVQSACPSVGGAAGGGAGAAAAAGAGAAAPAAGGGGGTAAPSLPAGGGAGVGVATGTVTGTGIAGAMASSGVGVGAAAGTTATAAHAGTGAASTSQLGAAGVPSTLPNSSRVGDGAGASSGGGCEVVRGRRQGSEWGGLLVLAVVVLGVRRRRR